MFVACHRMVLFVTGMIIFIFSLSPPGFSSFFTDMHPPCTQFLKDLVLSNQSQGLWRLKNFKTKWNAFSLEKCLNHCRKCRGYFSNGSWPLPFHLPSFFLNMSRMPMNPDNHYHKKYFPKIKSIHIFLQTHM